MRGQKLDFCVMFDFTRFGEEFLCRGGYFSALSIYAISGTKQPLRLVTNPFLINDFCLYFLSKTK
jgi:hypothetical protein